MGRIARIVMPGWPHHITQRGNHRQTTFFKNHDREVYLKLLAQYKQLYRMKLIGYTLMSNHIHLISIPEFKNSLAKGVGRTNKDYSRWQNVQCSRTGHLWQARFFSCPVGFSSLPDVLAYVELNPIRASLVKRPEDWEWLSARAHIFGKDETGLLDMDWWNNQFTPDSGPITCARRWIIVKCCTEFVQLLKQVNPMPAARVFVNWRYFSTGPYNLERIKVANRFLKFVRCRSIMGTDCPRQARCPHSPIRGQW